MAHCSTVLLRLPAPVWTGSKPDRKDVGVRLRSRLLVALLILVVLGGCWTRSRVQPLGAYDQPFYLGIAFDLLHHGRFTDGFAFAGGDAATVRPAGMRFTPVYPVLLAALATVDPGLRSGMDCLVAHGGQDGSCTRRAASVRVLQFLMLAATMGMLCWCGWRCSGRPRTGIVALALALPTAPLLLSSVDYLMTETVSLFLVTASQALALRALPADGVPPRPDPAWLFTSGLALGLAVLSRPAFAALAAAVLVAGAVRLAAVPGRVTARALAGFAAGIGVVVLPWILRNALVLGRPALSFGYASHTLVQRLSFDAMTGHDYAMSFVCWLPDGNGLGAALAGRHACDRFGWDAPDSFYAIGIGPMLVRTLAEAGGWSHHMSFLLHGFLLRDPLRQLGWHALVTLPLALRGLYIDHWWGFALAPVCAVATIRALRRRGATDTRFLVLCLPGWFMLGLNAAVAVNQVRYNLILVMPFSVAGALAVERGLRLVLGTRLPGRVAGWLRRVDQRRGVRARTGSGYEA